MVDFATASPFADLAILTLAPKKQREKAGKYFVSVDLILQKIEAEMNNF